MSISAQVVKELREKTGAGMMDCKKALLDSNGDMEKAIEFLRKSGIAKAEKKGNREAKEGIVYSYIHLGGRLGVLVEVNLDGVLIETGGDLVLGFLDGAAVVDGDVVLDFHVVADDRAGGDHDVLVAALEREGGSE